MPAAGRVSDLGKVDKDAHGCPACPHVAVGPCIMGSTDVFINSLPACRETDIGMHAVCCGPNMWTAAAGSPDVFVNSLALHRKDDKQTHCGGDGKLIMGSANVIANG
jgi:uncharacterized Zn-binding protein involved in type VI secretion